MKAGYTVALAVIGFGITCLIGGLNVSGKTSRFVSSALVIAGVVLILICMVLVITHAIRGLERKDRPTPVRGDASAPVKEPTAETKAADFNERIVEFNRHLQDVVDHVLLVANPELRDRVLTVKLPTGTRRLPVVSLSDARLDRFGQDAVTVLPFLADEMDSTRHDRGLIDFIAKTGRVLWDNDVFRLLDVSGQNELSFGITRYFKALTTCDRFLYELVRRFPTSPTRPSLASLAELDLLSEWRETVNRIVINKQLHHISAAVGVSVLSVFRHVTDDGTNVYLYPTVEQSLEKNSASDRHVIPSFMFEPFTASYVDRVKELDLEYQVLREFGEEVLGIKDLSRSVMHWKTVYGMIESNVALKTLRSLLRSKHAVLRVTGLWLDLLRLRPEVTCTLIVDDVDYLKSHMTRFTGSWENVPGVKWSRLESEAEYASILSDGDSPLCPPGAAALVGGRAFALSYLKGKTEAAREGRGSSNASI